MTMLEAVAPTVSVPRLLNVAEAYVVRPAAAGPERVAYLWEEQRVSYGDLLGQTRRAAAALAGLGVEIEQRVAILLPNRPEWVAACFGAIALGAVAAPISTAVTVQEQALLLADSRARVIVTTAALWGPLRERRTEFPYLRQVVIVGGGAAAGEHDFADLLAEATPLSAIAPTTCDDVALWLHTSGSTGTPKWAVHLHKDLLFSEQLYARPYVGLRPDDVVLSVSPLYHAYGLGLSTYFALPAGATVLLNSERPTPARVFDLVQRHGVTVFVGVPTLYAQLLAAVESGQAPDLSSLRLCLSAAEPLPAALGQRWRARYGIDIIDGIGTTEALHVFLSNKPGDVRLGSTGRPVPGYEVRLVDDAGQPVAVDALGNLELRGGSVFAGYWNRQEITQRVFHGDWYRTGDTYRRDADGYYWYSGRSDDMLRVSGHWVSPAEVEGALIEHPAVLEAAVVGKQDADELTKPQAFVILRPGFEPSAALATDLQNHIKATLAPYTYPRWVEFVAELPKTATGKIQRYKLRA